MDDTQRKRNEVAQAYSGPGWTNKVRMMSDQQVIAVYLRLKRQGKVA